MTLFYDVAFYVFGIVAVVSACIFVTRKSPVAAALWLVNVLFCLSALYILLDAQFIGVIQVLVYAGAIMVVFLFVIMLLNLGQPGQLADTKGIGPWLAAGGLAILVLATVMARLPHFTPIPSLEIPSDSLAVAIQANGAVEPFAKPLFTDYLLAFEVTSVLLLAAVVGAVAIGRRRSEEEAQQAAGPTDGAREEGPTGRGAVLAAGQGGTLGQPVGATGVAAHGH
jgi:NADH-quinone oxidoreductase subunit J